MIPIQELLNRICWDEEFSKAEFKIGYYDRLENEIIVIPFEDLKMVPDDHFCVEIIDNLSTVHMVPLHRIKQVFRNGELIWQRTH